MLIIQIGLALRAPPILKSLTRLLPELHSTRSCYYYLFHGVNRNAIENAVITKMKNENTAPNACLKVVRKALMKRE